ncbi:MAG: hypothetical protein WBV94_00745 [Blastocatellia bacterium]
MTGEQMERAIEFLLEHHAKFSADIEHLKEAQKQQGENIKLLFETTTAMQAQAEAMQAQAGTMQAQAEADRTGTREILNSVITEIREGFNNLILGNEVTRDLANKVAALEIQTSHRVTNLEQRVGDIETKL